MTEVGAEIILLHMDNSPYGDQRSLDNVKLLAERLRKATGQEMPLYSAKHGPTQEQINETCDVRYQCVMCKHVMQRVARDLCKRLDCVGIVMGDSLGQVASQTLLNIRAENTGLDFPVLRPLIGFDKLEIEEIAKKIGTYDISISPSVDCTLVPRGPVTNAEPCKVMEFNDLAETDELVMSSVDSAVRIS